MGGPPAPPRPKSITPPAADGPSPENINRAIDEENPEFAFKPAVTKQRLVKKTKD